MARSPFGKSVGTLKGRFPGSPPFPRRCAEPVQTPSTLAASSVSMPRMRACEWMARTTAMGFVDVKVRDLLPSPTVSLQAPDGLPIKPPGFGVKEAGPQA